MLEWLEGLAGPQFATAVFWTFAALLLLVIVLIIIKLIRGLTFGTFVAGGRNRKTRLAVMDAAAVDSHRRLVLVRRDDVEHLIMIGGPTDVVVERDIRLGQQRRAPDQVTQVPVAPQRERTIPPQPQRPVEAQPVVRQAPPPPAPQQRAPQPARPREASQPPRQAAPQPPARQAPAPHRELTTPPVPRPSPQPAQSLDDTLLKELEVSFGAPPAPAPAPKAAPPPKPLTLDDEMTKLLGELGRPKR